MTTRIASSRGFIPGSPADFLLPLAIACGLALLSQAAFLWFHVLVELFAVVIGISLYLFARPAYAFTREGFLLFLAQGFFWCACVDALHALSYAGMGLVPGNDPNPATQLWLLARGLEAATLAAAPMFVGGREPPRWGFAAIGAIATAGATAIATGNFPDAFIEGQGLTRFKTQAETVIIAVLLLAGVRIRALRNRLDPGLMRALAAVLALTIASEFAFTQYVSVFGVANAAGHIMKFLAFWLLGVVIFRHMLVTPFHFMSRDATSFDAVPMPVVVLDAQGVVQSANQAARDVRPGATAGARLHERWHPPIPESACEPCRRLLQGEGWQGEVYDAAQARWYQIALQPVKVADKPQGFVHTQVDITRRKEAEAALRHSEERLRQAVRVADIGIFDYDHRTHVLYWSPEMCALMGWSADSAVDLKRYLAAVHREDARQVRREFREALHPEGDGMLRSQHRVVQPDGTVRWLLMRWQTSHAAGKRRTRLRTVGAALDMTERKAAEEAIRELNEELERKVEARTAELASANKELEAFAYAASHDLRTPLRSIDGFGRLLEEEYGQSLAGEGAHYLERIRRNTQRMAQLIEDLLGLSSVSRGPIERRAVDLSVLADEAVTELRRHQPERQIVVRIEPGIAVHADAGLVRIMLENLLGNAWKYTRHVEAPVIEMLREAAPSGMTGFVVRDNGAGFDMAYAGRLFNPFQRLHRSDEFEGTGVGLATVARIVRRHGGEVRAEGMPGQGAAFHVVLPAGED